MAENKTKPTRSSVAAFLKANAAGQQLKDCAELVKLFRELTGEPPKMGGPSIVGSGRAISRPLTVAPAQYPARDQ